jgi:hypothetical protein
MNTYKPASHWSSVAIVTLVFAIDINYTVALDFSSIPRISTRSVVSPSSAGPSLRVNTTTVQSIPALPKSVIPSSSNVQPQSYRNYTPSNSDGGGYRGYTGSEGYGGGGNREGANSGGGNGGSNNELANAWVVAVCANATDLSTACLNQGWQNATYTLARMYATAVAEKKLKTYITIIFPRYATQAYQIKFLIGLQNNAINVVRAQMEEALAKLVPLREDSTQLREWKKQVVIQTGEEVNQWTAAARTEANRGSSWSHDWSNSSHTMTGTDTNSFRQATSISNLGWSGQ